MTGALAATVGITLFATANANSSLQDADLFPSMYQNQDTISYATAK
jgi:hypothetical protein